MVVVEQLLRCNNSQEGDLEQSIFEFNIETPTEIICFVVSMFPTSEVSWEMIKLEILLNVDEIGDFSTFTENIDIEFASKTSKTNTWHNNTLFTPLPTGRIEDPTLDSDRPRTINHWSKLDWDWDWKEYWNDNGRSWSTSVQLNEENENWVDIATPSEGETMKYPDWGGKLTTTSKVENELISSPSIDKVKI